MSEKILRLENITMQFGGVIAVNNMNLEVGEGEIVSLIGPNGAGKTTAFNVITGVYQPTNGAVWYRGEKIVENYPQGKMRKLYKGEHAGEYTHALAPTPDKITRMGMARTFQNIRLWKDQTVFDNVLTAMHCRATCNLLTATFHLNRQEEARQRQRVEELLAEVNLSDVSGEKANSLPYGKQRRLEIARALATDPQLLLRKMLKIQQLRVSYGGIQALRGIDLEVPDGKIVTLIGANGAGKSTTLRTISGLVKAESGSIQWNGEELLGKPIDKIISAGIAMSPEGRRVFADLTVLENLKLGAYLRKDKAEIEKDLKWVYELFPRLEERNWQSAGTLSGGEQQMLAVGRALMSRPKLMMLDEPSLGLAPLVVQDIFSIIREINRQGVTVLLIEQNANMALKIADLAYVLETGNITMSGTGAELLANEKIKEAYLGKHR